MSEKTDAIFSVILIVGIIIVIFLVISSIFLPSKALSQDTLNEVCEHVTNNSIAVGEIVNINWRSRGDLKCIIPSYDHTQRIVIEPNKG